MLPARFDYHRPQSLDEALDLMDRFGDEAKVLAGGMSLIPLMKLRFASPGQLGSRALITADGRIEGWLAGACAEPTVIAQAGHALADGIPRLVFLGTPEELAQHRRQAVVLAPIACQSEGALEVYVEPVLPPPHLVVIGRFPAARALASLGSVLGWKTFLVDEETREGSARSEMGAPEGAGQLEAAGVKQFLLDRGVDEGQLPRLHPRRRFTRLSTPCAA